MPALRLSVALVVPGQPCTMWISSRESVVSEVPTGASLTRAPSACTTLTFLSDPELLSDDSLAVSSPRLSPDQCRIVYLQYPSLIPHHQCSQLCLVSWRWAVAGRGEGQPRLPTSPSWMQGWCESFPVLSKQSLEAECWHGGLCTVKTHCLESILCQQECSSLCFSAAHGRLCKGLGCGRQLQS